MILITPFLSLADLRHADFSDIFRYAAELAAISALSFLQPMLDSRPSSPIFAAPFSITPLPGLAILIGRR
jgi:hypothetical protein